MQILSVLDILNATQGSLISDSGEGEIKTITTDSRKAEEGALFIPLVGEKADGHDFIEQAVSAGAVSLTHKDIAVSGTVIKVRDTKKALGDIARYYKEKYFLPSVAITGSVGKTTTKDMVSAVLSEKYTTHKTPNNFNNDIGVPLTIFGIEKEHNMAVIEMGMNHFGEIEYLQSIAKPDCAIITNVGMSHIENLGSREGIFKAKMEITMGFTNKNTLFVNGDNEYLNTISNTPYRVVRFGMKPHNDVYAKDITNHGLRGVEFTVVTPDGEFPAMVTQPGVHNIYNALSAIAVGLHFGVTSEACARGLKNCQYTASRLEIAEYNGIEIINDCYNSSPDSVRAALKVMNGTTKTNKIAVLGDILEMGEYAIGAHYELGKDVYDCGVDMLITAGENAKELARGAKDMGMRNVVSFDTTEELVKEIKNLIKPDSCVLVKASHGMEFVKVTEALKA